MAKQGRVDVFPAATWPEAAPDGVGIDPEGLELALKHLRSFCLEDGIGEVAVVRRGYLVWKGEHTDRRHVTWSCSKSWASTVLGLLIQDGLCSLDTPAVQHAPFLKADYPTVTLRHFATMTSGYDAVGGAYEDDPEDGSPTPFDPAPPRFAPGERFQYWDDAMRVFALAMTNIARDPLEALFRRRIAERIGITNWGWRTVGEVRGLPVNDAAAGVETTALDMARFGLLYLASGAWEGQQLIDPDWVSQATSPQVPTTVGFGPPHTPRQERLDGRGLYGYNWWTNGITSVGNRYIPDAPESTYMAVGLNNNRCWVVPDWDLVLVRQGVDGNVPKEAWSEFFTRLKPAIHDL